MALTVLHVGYPLAPVGRDAVGGSEQILSHLDRALVGAGHASIVVAREGSTAAGTLVPVPGEQGAFDEAARARAQAAHRRAIAAALDRFPVDLVHMHGLDFHAYLPPPGVPVLVTLHVPLDWYAPGALDTARPDTWFNCVSEAQHQAFPPLPSRLPPIRNGVPVEELAARHGVRRYALMLARVCVEKGVHLAIDAAKRADIPLLIAGEVAPYEAHRTYFEWEVKPRLDARRRFLGPIGFSRKRRLLTAARCLLVPSTAPETSSLVAMEAAACGTPVVAFPSGALPEVVEHGRTGFLVRSVEDMAEAIGEAAALDRQSCRRVARERFSMERMAGQYLALYERLTGGRGRQDSAA